MTVEAEAQHPLGSFETDARVSHRIRPSAGFGAPGFRELLVHTVCREARRPSTFLGMAAALGLAELGLHLGHEWLLSDWGTGPVAAQLVSSWAAMGLVAMIGAKSAPDIAAVLLPSVRPLLALTNIRPGPLFVTRLAGGVFQSLVVLPLLAPVLLWCYTLGGLEWTDGVIVTVWWLQTTAIISTFAAAAGLRGKRLAGDAVSGALTTIGLIAGVLVLFSCLCLMPASTVRTPVIPGAPRPARPELFILALVTPPVGEHWTYGLSCLFYLGFAAFCSTILCSMFAERLEAPEDVVATPVPALTKDPVPSSSHHPRCAGDPWFWKDFYIAGGGWEAFSGRVALAVLFSLFAGLPALSPEIFPVPMALTIVGFLGWLGYDSIQVFSGEFQQNMWTTARLVPSAIRDIFVSKLKAAALRFAPVCLPPMVLIAAVAWHEPQAAVLTVLILIGIGPVVSELCLYSAVIPQDLFASGGAQLGMLFKLLLLTGATFFATQFLPMIWAGAACLASSALATTWLIRMTLRELEHPMREQLEGG